MSQDVSQDMAQAINQLHRDTLDTHTHTHTRIHACVSYMCNRKAVLNESVSLSTSSLLSSGYLEVYANTCVYSVCFDDRSLFNGNSLLHNPLAAAANNVCLTRQKV